jgi:hypothetical protein
MFWTQNPEIFVQQYRFQPNVFSGNEFPRFWDMIACVVPFFKLRLKSDVISKNNMKIKKIESF